MTEAAPKRAMWDKARRADLAWSNALQAHRAAVPGSPGLADRLRATAAAARGLAEIADEAGDVGFKWAPFRPVPEDVDVLPGELAQPHRWLSHPWVNVASAETAAAVAARGDSLEDLAATLRVLGECLDALASDAAKRTAATAQAPPAP